MIICLLAMKRWDQSSWYVLQQSCNSGYKSLRNGVQKFKPQSFIARDLIRMYVTGDNSRVNLTFCLQKKTLIRLINRNNGVIITTYQGIIDYQDQLYEFQWHYLILDEGHKIRNPDAQVTIACKRVS